MSPPKPLAPNVSQDPSAWDQLWNAHKDIGQTFSDHAEKVAGERYKEWKGLHQPIVIPAPPADFVVLCESGLLDGLGFDCADSNQSRVDLTGDAIVLRGLTLGQRKRLADNAKEERFEGTRKNVKVKDSGEAREAILFDDDNTPWNSAASEKTFTEKEIDEKIAGKTKVNHLSKLADFGLPVKEDAFNLTYGKKREVTRNERGEEKEFFTDTASKITITSKSITPTPRKLSTVDKDGKPQEETISFDTAYEILGGPIKGLVEVPYRTVNGELQYLITDENRAVVQRILKANFLSAGRRFYYWSDTSGPVVGDAYAPSFFPLFASDYKKVLKQLEPYEKIPEHFKPFMKDPPPEAPSSQPLGNPKENSAKVSFLKKKYGLDYLGSGTKPGYEFYFFTVVGGEVEIKSLSGGVLNILEASTVNALPKTEADHELVRQAMAKLKAGAQYETYPIDLFHFGIYDLSTDTRDIITPVMMLPSPLKQRCGTGKDGQSEPQNMPPASLWEVTELLDPVNSAFACIEREPNETLLDITKNYPIRFTKMQYTPANHYYKKRIEEMVTTLREAKKYVDGNLPISDLEPRLKSAAKFIRDMNANQIPLEGFIKLIEDFGNDITEEVVDVGDWIYKKWTQFNTYLQNFPVLGYVIISLTLAYAGRWLDGTSWAVNRMAKADLQRDLRKKKIAERDIDWFKRLNAEDMTAAAKTGAYDYVEVDEEVGRLMESRLGRHRFNREQQPAISKWTKRMEKLADSIRVVPLPFTSALADFIDHHAERPPHIRIEENTGFFEIRPSGSGKSTDVEAEAVRIINNQAGNLNGYRIVKVKLSSLVSIGGGKQGGFEAAVHGLLAQAEREGNVILFFDEAALLRYTGTHSGRERGLDVELLEVLRDGRVPIIFATTDLEFPKAFPDGEGDPLVSRCYIDRRAAPSGEKLWKIIQRAGIQRLWDKKQIEVTEEAARFAIEKSGPPLYKYGQPRAALDLLSLASELVERQRVLFEGGLLPATETHFTSVTPETIRHVLRHRMEEIRTQSFSRMRQAVLNELGELLLHGFDVEIPKGSLDRRESEEILDYERRLGHLFEETQKTLKLVRNYSSSRNDVAKALVSLRRSVENGGTDPELDFVETFEGEREYREKILEVLKAEEDLRTSRTGKTDGKSAEDLKAEAYAVDVLDPAAPYYRDPDLSQKEHLEIFDARKTGLEAQKASYDKARELMADIAVLKVKLERLNVMNPSLSPMSAEEQIRLRARGRAGANGTRGGANSLDLSPVMGGDDSETRRILLVERLAAEKERLESDLTLKTGTYARVWELWADVVILEEEIFKLRTEGKPELSEGMNRFFRERVYGTAFGNTNRQNPYQLTPEERAAMAADDPKTAAASLEKRKAALAKDKENLKTKIERRQVIRGQAKQILKLTAQIEALIQGADPSKVEADEARLGEPSPGLDFKLNELDVFTEAEREDLREGREDKAFEKLTKRTTALEARMRTLTEEQGFRSLMAKIAIAKAKIEKAKTTGGLEVDEQAIREDIYSRDLRHGQRELDDAYLKDLKNESEDLERQVEAYAEIINLEKDLLKAQLEYAILKFPGRFLDRLEGVSHGDRLKREDEEKIDSAVKHSRAGNPPSVRQVLPEELGQVIYGFDDFNVLRPLSSDTTGSLHDLKAEIKRRTQVAKDERDILVGKQEEALQDEEQRLVSEVMNEEPVVVASRIARERDAAEGRRSPSAAQVPYEVTLQAKWNINRRIRRDAYPSQNEFERILFGYLGINPEEWNTTRYKPDSAEIERHRVLLLKEALQNEKLEFSDYANAREFILAFDAQLEAEIEDPRYLSLKGRFLLDLFALEVKGGGKETRAAEEKIEAVSKNFRNITLAQEEMLKHMAKEAETVVARDKMERRKNRLQGH